MNLIIHRGTHQIGGSCVEIATTETRIIIDLGMPLSDPRDKSKKLKDFSLIGKTVPELIGMGILPKVSGLYWGLSDEKPIDAVFLSHPHPDHYGLFRYIRKDIPVFLGVDTDKMLRVAEVFQGDRIGEHDEKVLMSHLKPVRAGNIMVTPYLMDHSGYGAMAFLMEADGKKVFYSGDFRGHGRKEKLFEELLANPPKEVDILMLEGTMMGRQSEAAQTEEDLEAEIVNAARAREGMKLFICSGQNVDRLVTFYKASLRSDSIFVLDLYAANVLYELGKKELPLPQNGHRKINVLFTDHFIDKLSYKKLPEWSARFRSWAVGPTELQRMGKRAFVMFRDSSVHDLQKAGISKDSVMFYSQWRQYTLESSFAKTEIFLKKWDITLEHMHTSGHAILPDLKRLASAINPGVIVPIHTEHPGEYQKHFENKIECLHDGQLLPV